MEYQKSYKMMKWELLWKDLIKFISNNPQKFKNINLSRVNDEFFYCGKYSRLSSFIKKYVDIFLEWKAEYDNKKILEIKEYYMVGIDEENSYQEEEKWLKEVYPYLHFYDKTWYSEKLKEIKEKYNVKD